MWFYPHVERTITTYMRIAGTREALLLLAGDVLLLYIALWITLAVRSLSVPESTGLDAHLVPFSLLFVVWVLVFFIAGLYEKRTLLLRSKLPGLVLRTQVVNVGLAMLFFYLIPYFGITPKTNLFIYLIISTVFLALWRLYGAQMVGVRKRQTAILIGSGEEAEELFREVNEKKYGIEFISSINVNELERLDFENDILPRIYSEGITLLVVDMRDPRIEPLLPKLYNLIFSGVQFIDVYRVYEDIFDRVPLSLVRYNWFLEHVSSRTRAGYALFKRAMDIIVAGVLGALSLVVYPFVYIAVKMEDGGPIFFKQVRVGKDNKPITILKFRSMGTRSQGEGVEEDPHVTKIGKILRSTRIDEIPQLWNVLGGGLSLIGPRPEVHGLVDIYAREVPYYNVRHLIKPGLSGWAQMYHDEHPHHGLDIEETKHKLSYDLYYLKNQSILLDLRIALRTIAVLLSRKGK